LLEKDARVGPPHVSIPHSHSMGCFNKRNSNLLLSNTARNNYKAIFETLRLTWNNSYSIIQHWTKGS